MIENSPVIVTEDQLREIGQAAQWFTNGRFKLVVGAGYSPDGRYMNLGEGSPALAWNDPAEAAAYLLGAMLGTAYTTGDLIPQEIVESLRPVLTELGMAGGESSPTGKIIPARIRELEALGRWDAGQR